MVVKFLKRKIFTHFGTPKAIISDSGSHFYNYLIERILKKYNMTHKVITPYHPQTNGLVEISNKEIKSMIKKTINNSRKDWNMC